MTGFGLGALPTAASLMSVLGKPAPLPLAPLPQAGLSSIASTPKPKSHVMEMVIKHHSKNKKPGRSSGY